MCIIRYVHLVFKNEPEILKDALQYFRFCFSVCSSITYLYVKQSFQKLKKTVTRIYASFKIESSHIPSHLILDYK